MPDLFPALNTSIENHKSIWSEVFHYHFLLHSALLCESKSSFPLLHFVFTRYTLQPEEILGMAGLRIYCNKTRKNTFDIATGLAMMTFARTNYDNCMPGFLSPTMHLENESLYSNYWMRFIFFYTIQFHLIGFYGK